MPYRCEVEGFSSVSTDGVWLYFWPRDEAQAKLWDRFVRSYRLERRHPQVEHIPPINLSMLQCLAKGILRFDPDNTTQPFIVAWKRTSSDGIFSDFQVVCSCMWSGLENKFLPLRTNKHMTVHYWIVFFFSKKLKMRDFLHYGGAIDMHGGRIGIIIPL
ncbi:hypothetical protein CAPTEDRAFT_218583 [Capitella teleta]|uniref:Uncharacterized protein n=1 Tax=Capitella teleta TaxID=283909 RepID=R7TRW8_CAPTE|nr:hypothetical protein CAPTEDRAFT_218583 [Capitella teleta]|eukprot:ELT96379.1 hypothetical protein CAPTEDRAFT_218583 [Capitella teleta]